MRAGDIVRVDFGVPLGSEPGFARPAFVVTATSIMESNPRTFHVIPITATVSRRLPTEIPVTGAGIDRDSVAECHLVSVISAARVVGAEGNVGPATLAQARAVLADLFDIP